MYVNASAHSKDGWLEEGGEVYKVDKALTSAEKITGSYPGINGLTIDKNNNLHFTTGDLEFLTPYGALYKMSYNSNSNQYTTP